MIKKIIQLLGNLIKSFYKKEPKINLEDFLVDEAIANPPLEEAVKTPEKVSRIKDWAKAIEIEESSKPPKSSDRNRRNNNCGNLKASNLIQSFEGYLSKDLDNFAIFKDYNSGFNALCKFLTLAAENKLVPYKNARTLYQFTKVYAEPPNDNYVKNVALALKVININADISTLL